MNIPESPKFFETEYYQVELEDEDASVGVTPTGIIFSYRVTNKRTKATEGFFFTFVEAIDKCIELTEDLRRRKEDGPEFFIEDELKGNKLFTLVKKNEDITH